MEGFEIPFGQQVCNVFAGDSADGAALPLQRPLPCPAIEHAHQVLDVAYLHVLHQPAEVRARDDVRTFIIWMTAAHHRRFARQGEFAATHVSALGFALSANPMALCSLASARRIMPDYLTTLAATPRQITDARRCLVTINLELKRIWAKNPSPRFNCRFRQSRCDVVQYTSPLTLEGPLRDGWCQHLAALRAFDGAPDHAYWLTMLERRRQLYAMTTEGVTWATFSTLDHVLDELSVYAEAPETAYSEIASALTTLGGITQHITIPRTTSNPDIARLLGEYRRRMDDLQATLARVRKHKGWWRLFREGYQRRYAARARKLGALVGVLMVMLLLSFVVPVAYLIAPHIAEAYVHTWRVLLHLESQPHPAAPEGNGVGFKTRRPVPLVMGCKKGCACRYGSLGPPAVRFGDFELFDAEALLARKRPRGL